jgi:hypothetical protein
MKVSLSTANERPIITISPAYANICSNLLNIVPLVFIQEAETNNMTKEVDFTHLVSLRPCCLRHSLMEQLKGGEVVLCTEV